MSAPCTPMTTAAEPPLPADTSASAPARRSGSVKVVQPLAICGQIRPWTPPLLQKATCAASESRSSLLSPSNGVCAVGNRPRSSFGPWRQGAGAAAGAPESACALAPRPVRARPTAPAPRTCRKSRRAKPADLSAGIALLMMDMVLAPGGPRRGLGAGKSGFDPDQHLFERVPVQGHAQTRGGRGLHIAVLVDAELLVEIGAVGQRWGIGHLEPVGVGQGQLQLEVNRQVEAVAPVVGRAGHPESVGQLAHPEGARDAADTVRDQPDA